MMKGGEEEIKWKEVKRWRGGGAITCSVSMNGQQISGHFMTRGIIVQSAED